MDPLAEDWNGEHPSMKPDTPTVIRGKEEELDIEAIKDYLFNNRIDFAADFCGDEVEIIADSDMQQVMAGINGP